MRLQAIKLNIKLKDVHQGCKAESSSGRFDSGGQDKPSIYSIAKSEI